MVVFIVVVFVVVVCMVLSVVAFNITDGEIGGVFVMLFLMVVFKVHCWVFLTPLMVNVYNSIKINMMAPEFPSNDRFTAISGFTPTKEAPEPRSFLTERSRTLHPYLHSLPSFSTTHSMAALPLPLLEETVFTMIPSM